jgi:predicted RND superfamily exporter protein
MQRESTAFGLGQFSTNGGFYALLIATDVIILLNFEIVTVIGVFFAPASTMIVLLTLIVWVDSRQDRRHPARSLQRVRVKKKA